MASDNPNSLQTGFSKPIDNLYTLNSLVAARHDALTYGALTMRRDGTVELYRMARGSNGQVEASKSKVAIQSARPVPVPVARAAAAEALYQSMPPPSAVAQILL
jgi:hypothetical protein